MGPLIDSEDCQGYREVLRCAKALANAVSRLHVKLESPATAMAIYARRPVHCLAEVISTSEADMELGQVLLWSLLIVGGLAAPYGVHRLCLSWEKRGWLYYKYKKPASNAASSFVALQQFLEPPVQHVLQVKEEKSPGRRERETAILKPSLP
jgi:hypothetical protein